MPVELNAPERAARALAAPPPAERVDPSQELLEVERLHEVVVRAGAQAGHPLAHGAPGREEQHRRMNASLTKSSDDAHAIELWQVPIEDDDVVIDRGGLSEGGTTVFTLIDHVSFFAETTPEQARHSRIVFHDEDLHVARMASLRLRVERMRESHG